MTSTVSVSRILLFTEPADLQPTVAAIAAAAGAEPTWQDMVRRDGSVTPQGSVTVGGGRIEVSGGTPELPAVLELTVPDPEAAAERAAEAGGYEAKETMLGWSCRVPGMTIALRAAE